MTLATTSATQVYPIFIKATPQAIWDAITRPEFSQQYFYGARIENTPTQHKALGPDGSDWGTTRTLEFDAPRRLVYEWTSFWDPEAALEPASRVVWEVAPADGGYSLLTVTHDGLEHAPKTAASVAGTGWMLVLSGLKTLLETGAPLS